MECRHGVGVYVIADHAHVVRLVAITSDVRWSSSAHVGHVVLWTTWETVHGWEWS